MTLALPRYVIAKPLTNGRTAFYFNVPKKYRDLGCTVPRTSLGTDYLVACGDDGNGGRAAALNALFDEWDTARHGLPVTGERAPIYGTIRWLFQEYRRSKAYLEKVSKRSRPDYERTMQLIEGITTKKGDKLGDRKIRSISPVSADKIYEIIPEAEAILEKLPQRGVPMILREIKTRKGVAFKPYSYSGFEKLVQNLRKKIKGLPSDFTLDACRHGGMTELEEAALTEGQGRALSGHKTAQAYRGYAKETFDRALSATRKRHAHRLENANSTSVQNGGQIGVQNEKSDSKKTNAK